MKTPIMMNVHRVRVNTFCLFLTCSGSEGGTGFVEGATCRIAGTGTGGVVDVTSVFVGAAWTGADGGGVGDTAGGAEGVDWVGMGAAASET